MVNVKLLNIIKAYWLLGQWNPLLGEGIKVLLFAHACVHDVLVGFFNDRCRCLNILGMLRCLDLYHLFQIVVVLHVLLFLDINDTQGEYNVLGIDIVLLVDIRLVELVRLNVVEVLLHS